MSMDKKGRLFHHRKHILTVDSKGIWKLLDKDAASSIGYMANGYCNVYTIYGLQADVDKYIAVPLDIFKFRRELEIKSLRRHFQEVKYSSNGQVLTVQYGYISRSKMKTLLSKRKILKERPQGVPVVLTKKSDWEMHSK